MTTVGLEPTIFGSEDRRLIHWATRPSNVVGSLLRFEIHRNFFELNDGRMSHTGLEPVTFGT